MWFGVAMVITRRWVSSWLWMWFVGGRWQVGKAEFVRFCCYKVV